MREETEERYSGGAWGGEPEFPKENPSKAFPVH